MIDLTLRVPYGYGTTYRPLSDVQAWLLVHHHPEYVRRLVAWLSTRGGAIGIGSGWRADGTQPGLPGFAPEGKSFHQNQRYNDGYIGAAAVDLVARDGPDAAFSHDSVSWSTVLPQGSAAARDWGIHCNVSTEPWHLQPIEIDGWQTWLDAGSPAPRADYPLPVDAPPVTPPAPPTPEPVLSYVVERGDGWYLISHKVGVSTARLVAANSSTLSTMLHPGQTLIVPTPERGYRVQPNDGWYRIARGLQLPTTPTTYARLQLQLRYRYRRSTPHPGDVLTA